MDPSSYRLCLFISTIHILMRISICSQRKLVDSIYLYFWQLYLPNDEHFLSNKIFFYSPQSFIFFFQSLMKGKKLKKVKNYRFVTLKHLVILMMIILICLLIKIHDDNSHTFRCLSGATISAKLPKNVLYSWKRINDHQIWYLCLLSSSLRHHWTR